jgi:transposase
MTDGHSSTPGFSTTLTDVTLGQHRWVVERTLAWLNRFRRLTIRYERRADIHEAFVTLGCALICLNQISRFC